jgi:hypothetical protein
MRPTPREPEPRPEDARHPGTEAQEQDPTIGPGAHPDAEQDSTPDETTPGGRP